MKRSKYAYLKKHILRTCKINRLNPQIIFPKVQWLLFFSHRSWRYWTISRILLWAMIFSLSWRIEYEISPFHLATIPPILYIYILADSGFLKNFLYQGGVKSTVSWVFEDLNRRYFFNLSYRIFFSKQFFKIFKKNFCIKVAWSLQFLGYLRTLKFKISEGNWDS